MSFFGDLFKEDSILQLSGNFKGSLYYDMKPQKKNKLK